MHHHHNSLRIEISQNLSTHNHSSTTVPSKRKPHPVLTYNIIKVHNQQCLEYIPSSTFIQKGWTYGILALPFLFLLFFVLFIHFLWGIYKLLRLSYLYSHWWRLLKGSGTVCFKKMASEWQQTQSHSQIYPPLPDTCLVHMYTIATY